MEGTSWESTLAAWGRQVHHRELWPAPYFSVAKLSSKYWLEDLLEAPRDSHCQNLWLRGGRAVP